MRKLAFLAPLAATMALAAAAQAEPQSINVTFGPELQARLPELGEAEVQRQADRLAEFVARAVADTPALDGARIDLILTDLDPTRPTRQQVEDEPGLDPIRSVSIGGATFNGQITMADGRVEPIRYDWYANNLAETHGYSTWGDAERAFRRLGDHLARGRYVTP
jgi:hypothetical protein